MGLSSIWLFVNGDKENEHDNQERNEKVGKSLYYRDWNSVIWMLRNYLRKAL